MPSVTAGSFLRRARGRGLPSPASAAAARRQLLRSKKTSPAVGSGFVTAATMRSSSRTTKRLPPLVAASSWTSVRSPAAPRSGVDERPDGLRQPFRGAFVVERRRERLPFGRHEDCGLDLRRDLREVSQRLGRVHRADASRVFTCPMRVWVREMFVKYQADRGTQLAAMIAYYALLAFVPLIFLTRVAARALRAGGRVDVSRQASCRGCSRGARCRRSCARVNEIQDLSTAIGLDRPRRCCSGRRSASSARSSGLQHRVRSPNRPFLHGKAWPPG